MEVKEIIEFLNLVPGVKASAVAATGVKVESMFHMGHILYESTKGLVDCSFLVQTENNEVVEFLTLLESEYPKGGVTPAMISMAFMPSESLGQLLVETKIREIKPF